jgi:hypothetical protein
VSPEWLAVLACALVNSTLLPVTRYMRAAPAYDKEDIPYSHWCLPERIGTLLQQPTTEENQPRFAIFGFTSATPVQRLGWVALSSYPRALCVVLYYSVHPTISAYKLELELPMSNTTNIDTMSIGSVSCSYYCRTPQFLGDAGGYGCSRGRETSSETSARSVRVRPAQNHSAFLCIHNTMQV